MAFEQQKPFLYGMKYPLSAHAVRTPPVPCTFLVGAVVTFTNEYGVSFHNKVVTGFSKTVDYGRFIYLDQDCWWFPVSPESLSGEAAA